LSVKRLFIHFFSTATAVDVGGGAISTGEARESISAETGDIAVSDIIVALRDSLAPVPRDSPRGEVERVGFVKMYRRSKRDSRYSR
jgi:hypothetical protein